MFLMSDTSENFCVATCCCNNHFNETFLCYGVSILVINPIDSAILGMINVKKLHGKSITLYLWFNQIQNALGHNAYSSMTLFPLPLIQEGIHNDGHPHCIWCICGHRCTGSHFLAYAQVQVRDIGWIYHLASQQQFGFSSYCNNINS